MGYTCDDQKDTCCYWCAGVHTILWDQWCVLFLIVEFGCIELESFLFGVVLNYFGPTMYAALGLSASKSLLVQGIYGAVGPIANFL